MKKQLIPIITLISVLLFTLVLCGAVSANGLDNVYVATDGDDTWDGSSPTPGPGNVGPVQSIEVGLSRVKTDGNVNLAAGTYNKTGAGHSDVNLAIDRNMNIIGAGTSSTIIDALGSSKIFKIESSATVTIKDLTMKNGEYGYGGAIGNLGTLTVTNCAFTNNHATTNGGAIYSNNQVNIQNSQFNGNFAGSGVAGGAVYIQNGAASISNSQFTANHADWNGGAIYINMGDVSIANSQFTGNHAGNAGGAIYNRGKLTVTSSQFTSNYLTALESQAGGAIFSGYLSDLLVTGSTFQGNSALGGAIHLDAASYRIIGNNIINNQPIGVYIFSGGAGGPVTPTYRNVNLNRIIGNEYYGVYLRTPSGGAFSDDNTVYLVDATNNWWGSNSNPQDNPKNIGGDAALVDTDPWLILTILANPTSIPYGGTSTITARVTINSNGEDTSGLGHIPDGTFITITTDLGNVGSKQVTYGTVNGIITAILRANDGWGTARLFALLDGFWTPIPANVVITQAAGTEKTIGMQKTGAPIAGLILATLMVLGGLFSTRKK
ncbi:MAG: hypothetical protein HVN35_11170 [Methanobacteriaceae archaeon]|nr:hypothetical protein [Methanobacteriaceae archaeon]